VGSANATKVAAAQQGFAAMLAPQQALHAQPCAAAASGVPPQPMGDAETRLGARNRALGALAAAAASGAVDFAVGIEGGCGEEFGELVCFAWVCVVGAAGGRESFARTASFALPRGVAELVRGGMELGAADDAVFGRVGSKHGEGAVGLLTRGAISRTAYYAHAVTLACVPFLSSQHFD
jgi:inosine/xanthosine triphosphatase